MEWFVQTPEHSFKSTFFDRIPLVVFSPGACLSEYTAWLQDPFSCGVVHLWCMMFQYYAKKSPTKVAKAYEKAGYFERNVRMIEVLIDQDAIRSGAAAAGEPWRFYDLGHGYCTYDFFDQCPHRMACARCSFYRPKGSTQAQLMEGKANLLRMLQEIPLSEEERAAVEDGIAAMEKLCQQLTDVPTPAGPTPNQLALDSQSSKTVIPVEHIRRKR